MPRPPSRCSSDLQGQAMDLAAKYLAQKGYSFVLTFFIRAQATDWSVSTLEIIEHLSRLLEGHRPSFLFGVAASFFPEYNFEYSLDPEDSVPVLAMTLNGPKTLYQVAKEVCRADKPQKILFPIEYENAFKARLPDCSDQPYLLDVFQELQDDRETGLFGFFGFISRVVLLFRDEPGFLGRLNAHLPSSKLQVMIVEKPNEHIPVLVLYPSGVAMEYVSKEGCQELLDRIDYHRRLWLRHCS